MVTVASELLGALAHPGARRRFVVASPLPGERPEGLEQPEHPGALEPLGRVVGPGREAARRAAHPVAGLGVADLAGALAFHTVAVAVVDLATSLLVVAGGALVLDPHDLLLGFDGGEVATVAVGAVAPGRLGVLVDPSGPSAGVVGRDGVRASTAAELAAAAADLLVGALDPLARTVEPADEPARWGATADLVAVLAAGRQRAHGLDPDGVWAAVDAVVDGLRSRRPHPAARPARLAVPAPDGGSPLALARRSTCCQWHRAARGLGATSVADARCADCPSLDAASNVARLSALAAAGGLVAP